MTAPTACELRRVEAHMGTVVTLAAHGVDEHDATAFFARVAELESLLSRFRAESEITRLATGDLVADEADRSVREVLARCVAWRDLTAGDFEHEPRRRSGDAHDPVLDVNALAKGWIVEDAATVLGLRGAHDLFVNAGGDVLVTERARPWRIGIQHPTVRDAVLAVLELPVGAVATSGAYERGAHIRGAAGAAAAPLQSVTVVGPDLADADALATAVYASGCARPHWWDAVRDDHALLTVDAAGALRWTPATRHDSGRLLVG